MDSETKVELRKITSMRDSIAVRSNYPSLGRIELDRGVQVAEQYILLNIKYITDILGFEFNTAQFDDCIQSILMIRWLTVADFKAFLEYCKAQKFYRRDYKEFLDAFQAYVNGSLDTAEGDSMAEHNSRKAEEMQNGRRENRPVTLKDIYGF